MTQHSTQAVTNNLVVIGATVIMAGLAFFFAATGNNAGRDSITGVGGLLAIFGAVLTVQVHDRVLPSDKLVDLVGKCLAFAGTAAAFIGLLTRATLDALSLPVLIWATIGVTVGLIVIVAATKVADRNYTAQANAQSSQSPATPQVINVTTSPVTTAFSVGAFLLALLALVVTFLRL
jgi:ABC-type protease/lipase transport system fused ATPase/permease subunit